MVWGESEDIYEAFQRLSPPAIVVTSSGNRFPVERLERIKSKASKKFGAIVVGSFSPEGWVSDFSSSGEEIHIIAPSDRWISFAGRNGKYKKFGGTSGATPLVTGSLAKFEWLSGYHPTPKEAKVLLEKTAFPTLHSHEELQVNGVGLLNAYKLGAVGLRLKKKCQSKGESCFKKEIFKEENYLFDIDKNLKKDLSQSFPSCAIGKKLNNSLEGTNCNQKRTVLIRLRKAIFLNPKKSQELLKSLSCIYKEGGFLQNTEALNKLAAALLPIEEVRDFVRALAKQKMTIPFGILRLVIGIGGIEKNFEFLNVRFIIATIGVRGMVLARSHLEKAIEMNDTSVQSMAVTTASYIDELGVPILKKAAIRTNNLEVHNRIVSGAVRMGEQGVPVLKKVMEISDSEEIQEEVIFGAMRMGIPGFFLLKKLSNSRKTSESLRRKIKFLTRKLSRRGIPEKN